MASRPEASRNLKARTSTEIIDISSDGDDGLPLSSARDQAGTKKQKRNHSGSMLKTSQSQASKSHIASGPRGATTRPDTDSSHSGSQNSRAQTQQRSKQSTPSANNTTLAQRTAGSISNGRANNPPASQVQISRGVNGASSSVSSGTDATKVTPVAFGKVSNAKRSLERDGTVGGSPATKRLKVTKEDGQSTGPPPKAKRPSTLPGTHKSPGSGIDSNPIVISDSPPPPNIHHKRRGDNISSDRQQQATQSRKLAPKSAGRASVGSSPKPKTTKPARHEDAQRETVDQGTSDAKSPTIPESLPGSPSERDGANTFQDVQSPSMPLFNHPSKETSGNPVETDIESISNFAEQAEAILASQTNDTSAAAAATHTGQPENDRGIIGPSSTSLKYPRRVAALQSAPKSPITLSEQSHSDKPNMPTRGQEKLSITPAAGTLDRILPSTSTTNLTPANNVEHVVQKYSQELRADNVYWTRTRLKRARQKTTQLSWSGHAPTSVFRDMRPIQAVGLPDNRRMSDLSALFSVETFGGVGKGAKRSYAVPCRMYHTSTDADVPNYSHFVTVKQSFLARNETVLQHWPYFHDEFDLHGVAELEQHYYLDVTGRERKIKRLVQAENYAEYVEDMLRDIDCTWSDVLRFLLDPRPSVGTNSEALVALRDREKFCDEDFVRGGQRWTTVLSKLPPSRDPDRVGRAALLCEYFKRITKFQLWHVARRSDYTAKLVEERDPALGLNEITCRVCMRFSCPYHGEIHENASGGSDSERDGSAAEDVVETDIIHPCRVNYRSRVAFPSSVDRDDADGQIDPRRKRLEYWHKMNLNHYPDDRQGPFYPCHHPGESCEKSRCACFENRIPCEKSCGCDSSCKFKWQGCDCRMKGAMVCFEDARCACFQNGRECDADLCGDCGVSDVLNPVHRHDNTILKGRCHNASIQRGIPKHTILGDSGIHGLGLYACENIKHHDFVGEYKGEIITKEEAERRGAVYEHQKLSYLFSLNNKQEVDSTLFGSKVRFINHASEKQANLYPRIIMVNTVFRIALYGARPITTGQELLFDYGPQFPQDQLGVSGNKASKGGKAAPHVRNKNLVAQFDEVVESVDRFGNRRARKAAAGDKRGKAASKGNGAGSKGASRGGDRSVINRKSTTQRPGVHRGDTVSEASRARRGNIDEDEDGESGRDAFDDMDLDAGQRLSSYNVADDDYRGPVNLDDDEDDDFAPHSEHSSDDRRLEESSSLDGDDEDDGEVAMPTRQRSSRRRI